MQLIISVVVPGRRHGWLPLTPRREKSHIGLMSFLKRLPGQPTAEGASLGGVLRALVFPRPSTSADAGRRRYLRTLLLSSGRC